MKKSIKKLILSTVCALSVLFGAGQMSGMETNINIENHDFGHKYKGYEWELAPLYALDFLEKCFKTMKEVAPKKMSLAFAEEDERVRKSGGHFYLIWVGEPKSQEYFDKTNAAAFTFGTTEQIYFPPGAFDDGLTNKIKADICHEAAHRYLGHSTNNCKLDTNQKEHDAECLCTRTLAAMEKIGAIKRSISKWSNSDLTEKFNPYFSGFASGANLAGISKKLFPEEKLISLQEIHPEKEPSQSEIVCKKYGTIFTAAGTAITLTGFGMLLKNWMQKKEPTATKTSLCSLLVGAVTTIPGLSLLYKYRKKARNRENTNRRIRGNNNISENNNAKIEEENEKISAREMNIELLRTWTCKTYEESVKFFEKNRAMLKMMLTKN